MVQSNIILHVQIHIEVFLITIRFQSDRILSIYHLYQYISTIPGPDSTGFFFILQLRWKKDNKCLVENIYELD